MNCHWTEHAINHLHLIHSYIAQNSTVQAQKMVDKITNKSIQISEFPYSGRMVPEFECETIREIPVGSYRLMYRILTDRIDVMAVFHSSMDLF